MCKDLELEQQEGWSGWSEGQGRGPCGLPSGRRVDFFLSAIRSMRSARFTRPQAAPEALLMPHWVAIASFDEGGKRKHHSWVLPGSPDALASASLGLGVSGAGGGPGSLSGHCETSRLAASSDSSPGLRTDQVTAGCGVNRGE